MRSRLSKLFFYRNGAVEKEKCDLTGRYVNTSAVDRNSDLSGRMFFFPPHVLDKKNDVPRHALRPTLTVGHLDRQKVSLDDSGVWGENGISKITWTKLTGFC